MNEVLQRSWTEKLIENFWKKKRAPIQRLMNNAVERFTFRNPDASAFALTTDEFRQAWKKMVLEAEDFAGELWQSGRLSKREHETLRDTLIAAIGNQLHEIRDQAVQELVGTGEPNDAAPRRRGRPRTRPL